MKLFRLEKFQLLRVSVPEAWTFFSDPRNLEKITPPELHMVPEQDLPSRMHPGMIVTYRIRLLPGLRTTWVTEITHVEAPHMFVDEQRFGPYRFWHHLHRFTPGPQGVLAEDLVHYGLHGGLLAGWVDAALIRPRLERVFEFRRRILQERFGNPPIVTV